MTLEEHIKRYDDRAKSIRNAVVEKKESQEVVELLRELKAYREDTRFADLYERICIKRDDDREYFARTKDQTYITRIAEKEKFIHMMQNMMFDRYGVEEVNTDESNL